MIKMAEYDKNYLQERAREELKRHGFEPDFPPEAHVEIQESLSRSTDDRVDLRDLPWSSIDNEESRDLDQIEYAERAENGAVRLMIGIADVASVVRKDGAIDRRAQANTVSIYTPGKTFHLLPEELSTYRTSLLEGRDHNAVVVSMLIDKEGYLSETDILKARVRNHARFSYEEVAAFLDGHGVEKIRKHPVIREQIRLHAEVASRLILLRRTLGALTFSSFEPRPVRRKGMVVDMKVAGHNQAREIIEGFMIAANVAMARFLKTRGWPIIERVVPEPRRWDRIREIAASYGFELPMDPHPKPLSDFLAERRAADPRGFADLSSSVVKLMGPGAYQVEYPEGPQTMHFGLALEDYSHSTAPNRRYSDLIIQRLALALLANDPVPYSHEGLEQIAKQCTEREDVARKVERTMRKVASAFIMRDRIGEVFDAIVTGAKRKGTYVRLYSPAVEGKVVEGDAGMDVGERVKVRLLSVDPERGFIDFAGEGKITTK